jgi:hypothetical protein
MMALGLLLRLCGIFTEMRTKLFPCLHRVTALRRGGERADTRSTPSTLT